MFGDLQTRKKTLEKELSQAQENLDSIEVCNKEREIRNELEKLAEQEQIFWMQKSRTNWIIQGDRNTRFYHTVTKKKESGGKF